MNQKLASAIIVGILLCAQCVVAAEGVIVNRILIEKKAHLLTLFSGGAKIKSYKVSLGRGGLGRKLRKGDKLTPEGKYRIDRRNLNSAYHKALHISYPNKEDIARATAQGVEPGGDIMIHGIRNGLGWLGPIHRLFDWTLGCVALTNWEIEELWKLVPDGTEVEILP